LDSEYGKITHFLITWNCDSFYFFLEIGFSNCSVVSVESGDILPSKISFNKQKSQVQFLTISKRKNLEKILKFLDYYFFLARMSVSMSKKCFILFYSEQNIHRFTSKTEVNLPKIKFYEKWFFVYWTVEK
jgi:hypothetical protein